MQVVENTLESGIGKGGEGEGEWREEEGGEEERERREEEGGASAVAQSASLGRANGRRSPSTGVTYNLKDCPSH